MPDAAFFIPDGALYVPTEHTRGPWDPNAQHGGPPSALLAHALEQAYPSEGVQLVRISVEFLGPVPLAPLAVATEAVRTGRRVELLGATLTADGEPRMLARAWRVRTADIGVAAAAARDLPPPSAGSVPPFFPGISGRGWHTAVEHRFLEGGWNVPGPASVWFRPRMPLVAGRALAPVERALLVADGGNGVSATLDFTRYVFVNTDLTVSLHRLPAGEWVHLAAETRVEPHGIGLATSLLSDESGAIGRGAQSLFVAPRAAA